MFVAASEVEELTEEGFAFAPFAPAACVAVVVVPVIVVAVAVAVLSYFVASASVVRVTIVAVAIAPRVDGAVGLACGGRGVAFDDLVEFAAVEPHAAAGRAVVAEIEAIRRWLGEATAERTATTESQHDLTSDPSWQAALADGFARPSISECFDENGWPIEIEPSGDGLLLTRPDDPEVSGAIAVSVANEHLHLLVAGLIWRTYGEGSNTFTLTTRQNTAAYLDVLGQFEWIVRHRL